MADGTVQNGTAIVEGDEVTTVNGGAVSARQVQRIKIDSKGVNGEHTDVSPASPLPTQLSGITFTLSTANSSSVNLAAAATFTGTIESAFNQPAAQVMVFCDQPYTVQVDQFNDLSNLISTDTFTRAAGIPMNENVQVNGDFFRLRVTNNGAATTTNLRIETTYGPIPPLPRALSNNGNLKVTLNESGLVSTANSTAVNLAANATFTGTAEDLTDYANVKVSVFSSHASATDGLQMQQSSNGTNWDIVDAYSIPAASGKTFGFGPSAKFYRLVYTNGGTLTTSLRIQTMFHKVTKKGSSVRAQDARANDNDLEEMISYLALLNSAGNWDRARGSIWGGQLAQLSGFNPTYRLFIPAGAAGANKIYFDLFNATGSGRSLRVLSVVPVVSGAVAVTGLVAVDLFLTRTSAVGTTGTTVGNDAAVLTTGSITRMDPSIATVPAQITARVAPGGGATAGAVISSGSFFTEETSVAAYQPQDLVRRYAGPAAPNIIVPENTGIRVVQGAVASVGNIGFDVIFEVVTP